jgi:uncharacterized protein
MTVVKWLVVGAGIYIALVAAIYASQRRLMYFPDPSRYSAAAVGMPQAEAVEIRTSDGERLTGWHAPPRDDRPLVIYFQGNGGGLNLRAGRFAKLAANGFGVLAVNYRGYGTSSGSSSEEGLLRDADAIYAFAAARYPAERIALWGESLGTGVAVALAAERKVARVVLEAPFTSTAEIAASIYWFVPVRWLMRDQFRSDERIGKVTAPVLVIHGVRDTVVPFAYGERLFSLIKGPKTFERLDNAGHNDKDTFGATETIMRFLMN